MLLDVVQVDSVTGEGIPVRGSVDGPPSELLRICILHVVRVALVKYTVGKG